MNELNIQGQRMIILLKTMELDKHIISYKVTGLETCSSRWHIPEAARSLHSLRDSCHKGKHSYTGPYLSDVQLTTVEKDVGLFIRLNCPKALEPRKVMNSEGNGPYAVKTQLGWVLMDHSTIPTGMDEDGQPGQIVRPQRRYPVPPS